MQHPNKNPASADLSWSGEVDIQKVELGYLNKHSATNTIEIGGSINRGTYQGIVKQITQLRNGNLRISIAHGDGLRFALFSPLYQAAVKLGEK